MSKLTAWIESSATVKLLIVVSVISCLIRFGVMPWLHLHWMPADSPGPLDLMFAYSASEAAAQIAAFSDAGRAGYRAFLLTVDVVYPVTYTLIFVWAIAILKKRTTWAGSLAVFIAPLAAFGFDLLENITISLLLTLYPDQPTVLGWAASAFTTLKWLTVGVSLIVLSGLVVIRARSNKELAR